MITDSERDILGAFETYKNGNITDFKNWLKSANKSEICHITMLWVRANQDFLRLKSYIIEVQ